MDHDYELQSLSQRNDGTKLLSAVIPIPRFMDIVREAGEVLNDQVKRNAEDWRFDPECHDVIIDFVDGRESDCNTANQKHR